MGRENCHYMVVVMIMIMIIIITIFADKFNNAGHIYF